MQAAGAGARAEQGLEQEPLRTIEDALPGRGSVTRHGSLVSDQWSGANQTYLVWFSGCGRLATATARQDSGHIDGGTTRCSPPPIRKGGFDEPHLLRSPVSGHGKRTQLALERGQGWR